MTEDELKRRVLDLICDQLGADPDGVVLEARFTEDLGADSLDLVELMSAFEEEFETTIPDDDIEWLETVGDALQCLRLALQSVTPALAAAAAPGRS
jgi:acyl carrier protein